ncbi:Type III secretion cytoplasmic protein, YscL [Paraburkholderia caribensis MBA4]|uniref:Type III secretion cytoplasmic protein, YscL n=1 Tax=Paraburkholderia caribensis MBA4 TaxID=1323664 RepID=A0A0P0RDE5_9BURK|nr:Type III secretion cytoplasmic protein, YscL [Paraburkholderia caribensis MBA4]
MESDGYLSSVELHELDGLREVEASRAKDIECEIARLADRARALKRRAWQHGHDAGRRAALREFVVPSVVTSFASRCLEERLADVALEAIVGIVGELPADLRMRNRLRHCIGASRAQQLLSVRVSAEDYEDTQRVVHKLEQEMHTPLFKVLADAGLPRHSLVVETDQGVIDGSLTPQLRALERGIRDAIGAVLNEYRYIDNESAKTFAAIESGLRDVIDALAWSWESRSEGGNK